MTYDDMFTHESWNTEWEPGKGDNGPTLYRTRSFMIGNQSEWGYLGALQDCFCTEIVTLQGVYDDFHWSDPVYYAA